MKRPIRRPKQLGTHEAAGLASLLVIGIGAAAVLVWDGSIRATLPRIQLWALLAMAATYIVQSLYYAPQLLPVEPQPQPEPEPEPIEESAPTITLYGIVTVEHYVLLNILMRYAESNGRDTKTTRADWPIANSDYSALRRIAAGRNHMRLIGNRTHVTYRGLRYFAQRVGWDAALPPDASNSASSPEVGRDEDDARTENDNLPVLRGVVI